MAQHAARYAMSTVHACQRNVNAAIHLRLQHVCGAGLIRKLPQHHSCGLAGDAGTNLYRPAHHDLSHGL